MTKHQTFLAIAIVICVPIVVGHSFEVKTLTGALVMLVVMGWLGYSLATLVVDPRISQKDINLIQARIDSLDMAYAERIKKFEAFVRDVRDNWDCDEDSHRYDTPCRCCMAEVLLPKERDGEQGVSQSVDSGD